MTKYIFDSFAFLAFFQNEAGADAVAGFLETIISGKANGYITAVNLGEVYYMLSRKGNSAMAASSVDIIRELQISIVDVDALFCLEAARLKVANKISYADAFAAALTIRLKGHLITGDPEFNALSGTRNFRIIHIPQHQKKK